MSLATVTPLTDTLPSRRATVRAVRPVPAPVVSAPPAPTTHPRRVQPDPVQVQPLPVQQRVARPAPAETQPPVRIRAVPSGTRARGFALYVGFDEGKANAAGTDLGHVVEALKRLAAEIAPGSETYASVALAPETSGGRDIDVVRLALQDPAAVARNRHTADPADDRVTGVIVDISRKRLLLDNEPVGLTYKEFELLQYLVLREGRTIERAELIASLWQAGDDEAPNERTIDVHIRRLRSKLGRYEEIVRTVRGVGYRFDRHADVTIRQAGAPSPDLF